MASTRMFTIAALGAALMAAQVGATFAEERDPHNDGMSERHDGNDISNLSQAKVSMTQAVSAAESAVGGKVVDAQLERRNSGAVWEIEVAKTDGTMGTVMVDAVTGTVDANPAYDSERHDGNGDGYDGAE